MSALLAGVAALALASGGCAEPDPLVPGAYALSMLPGDGFFGGVPLRFELRRDGHVDGHLGDSPPIGGTTPGDYRRCRGDATIDELSGLTARVNEARFYDHPPFEDGAIDLHPGTYGWSRTGPSLTPSAATATRNRASSRRTRR